jgi:hypothetical protein
MNSSDAKAAVVPLTPLKRHTGALAESIHAATMRMIRSGSSAVSRELEAFEREFATWCDPARGIGLASGTEAIALALRAFDIGPGDEVIVAADAGMYSTTALLAIGATPFYADVRDDDLTLDRDAQHRAITPRTDAIIASDLYGRLADVMAFRDLCNSHDLAFNEVCANAGMQSRWRTRRRLGRQRDFLLLPDEEPRRLRRRGRDGRAEDAGLCRDDDHGAAVRRPRRAGSRHRRRLHLARIHQYAKPAARGRH